VNPDDYLLGSETVDFIKSEGVTKRSQQRPEERVPGGLCHAVERGTDTAVCGAGTVHVWDQPWTQGLVDRCYPCREATGFTS
jgi:hypothetical protein